MEEKYSSKGRKSVGEGGEIDREKERQVEVTGAEKKCKRESRKKLNIRKEKDELREGRYTRVKGRVE